MAKAIILGSGAATGVPSLSSGWGDCNPQNPKNKRQRAGLLFEEGDTRILIDTSADIKNQLIDCNIKTLSAVLYTHTHADHLHGIDDLRGITRNLHGCLKFYATANHLAEIKQRFAYALTDTVHTDITKHPELEAHELVYYEPLRIGSVEIMPLRFEGHTMITSGYCFNQGQLVLVPDFKIIPDETMDFLRQIDVNVLIMPLTMPQGSAYHADIETVLRYVKEIKARQVFITHMGTECDYDEIERQTPKNVHPAYDYLTLDL